jgi:bacteriocin-like protein
LVELSEKDLQQIVGGGCGGMGGYEDRWQIESRWENSFTQSYKVKNSYEEEKLEASSSRFN